MIPSFTALLQYTHKTQTESLKASNNWTSTSCLTLPARKHHLCRGKFIPPACHSPRASSQREAWDITEAMDAIIPAGKCSTQNFSKQHDRQNCGRWHKWSQKLERSRHFKGAAAFADTECETLICQVSANVNSWRLVVSCTWKLHLQQIPWI